MSFDWSQYLRLAQELFRQSRRSSIKEAKLRTAISRAYYAIFIRARNHLRDKDKRYVPRLDAHQYVIAEFSGNADKIYQQIGYGLAKLRSWRNRADYDDDFMSLVSLSSRALDLAERLNVMLDNL